MAETVVLTGISGYIGKHVALRLLEAGFAVRGTVRSAEKARGVRETLGRHLTDPGAIDRLSFVELDLGRDPGWAEAMRGADALVHTASPFPLEQPKDPEDLIRPAVDGALRALRAAHGAGIDRVVLTSSMAAVQGCDLPPGKPAYDEADWTDGDDPRQAPYTRSKTLAERAAWNFVRTEAPEIRLTTINPGLVVGAPLDDDYATSVGVVARILSGKDPVQPPIGLAIVDVGDVAEMHLRALTRDGTAGRRFIAADRFASFAEMAAILKDRFPERKVTTREAPPWLVRLIARFDRSLAVILPDLGRRWEVSNARARDGMGIDFRPLEDSLAETAGFLIERGRV